MDVDSAMDELYAVPSENFIAERDAMVAAARKAGDAKAATTIGKLRRPNRSAWLVNQLARHRGDELDQLLELGAALRDAQRALAGDDLRRLSAQRRSVVSALARDARALAADLGQPVNEAVQRDVESSLEAALADPEAAELVRSGRLTTALRHSGFGTGFDQAGVGELTKKPARKTVAAVDDSAALRKAVAAARADVKEAEKHERAEAASLTSAAARREKTVRRVAQLEEDLAHARQEDSAAADEVRVMHRRHDTAAKAANAARQKLQRAEDALDKAN